MAHSKTLNELLALTPKERKDEIKKFNSNTAAVQLEAQDTQEYFLQRRCSWCLTPKADNYKMCEECRALSRAWQARRNLWLKASR